ncbi:suppressor of rasval19 [Friedmanniomyces endolithicus]|nr:suppressor of rasval19 [Friedmanniomyces endolithicus]
MSRPASIANVAVRKNITAPVTIAADNPLTTLIHRLEAATSRLEDIASSAASFEHSDGSTPIPSGGPASSSAPELPALVERASQAHMPKAEPLPPAISDMDELIDTDVKAFVDASKGLDQALEEQAQSVAKAFADQRRFILVSTKSKKPDMQSPETFSVLLKDLQHDLGSVGDIKDSNRGSPVKEHLAMVAEGTGALQWLLMEGKLADYVAETIGGAQMYGNRVLTKYKEKDQAQVKYVQSYYALLKALAAYVTKHYPRGLTWNNNGTDAFQANRDIVNDTPATNGTPRGATPQSNGAPPPPPPPLPNFDNVPGASPPPSQPAGGAPRTAPGDITGVFEQLNRGESVTSGLKKVDKSQMTHKNPSLRATGFVPAPDTSRSVKSPAGPDVKPKPPNMRQNSVASTSTITPRAGTPTSGREKPAPKKELDGNKWIIENYDSPSEPLEVEVSLTQSLLISKCKNTTIVLKGKANAISIDNSPRLQILVDTLVSSVDVIKSPNFAVQITGKVPTVLLDQVDGGSIYLGRESLGTEVFTSKCSSVNVVLPPLESEEEGDSREVPLPEQIRTVIRGGRLVSEIVEHAG